MSVCHARYWAIHVPVSVSTKTRARRLIFASDLLEKTIIPEEIASVGFLDLSLVKCNSKNRRRLSCISEEIMLGRNINLSCTMRYMCRKKDRNYLYCKICMVIFDDFIQRFSCSVIFTFDTLYTYIVEYLYVV